ANAILDGLEFRRSHTAKCQRKNGIERWANLPDKRCACPYYSIGIHGPGQRWERKPTGEIAREKARAIVLIRLRSDNPKATIYGPGIPISDAITDFMGTVESKERTASTYVKYRTLMDQLQAFCDHAGYTTIQSFDQNAMQEFWKSWRDPKAPYKAGTKWRKNSLGTCKRNLKTMRLLFRRCIVREWIKAEP